MYSVHSTLLENVQRGIVMFEATLSGANSPSQKSEKLYLLAVGCYRSGEYSRSLQLVEKCLEVSSLLPLVKLLRTFWFCSRVVLLSY
ncbi:unnamed protein product [Coffea canephora]|uniref:Uncharacterized protein n=1 Tax=Coffea canephora TaxID=49390 RepID=A0A068TQ39_COFCA|nr:unnamed protein product [Coffea canephora]